MQVIDVGRLSPVWPDGASKKAPNFGKNNRRVAKSVAAFGNSESFVYYPIWAARSVPVSLKTTQVGRQKVAQTVKNLSIPVTHACAGQIAFCRTDRILNLCSLSAQQQTSRCELLWRNGVNKLKCVWEIARKSWHLLTPKVTENASESVRERERQRVRERVCVWTSLKWRKQVRWKTQSKSTPTNTVCVFVSTLFNVLSGQLWLAYFFVLFFTATNTIDRDK